MALIIVLSLLVAIIGLIVHVVPNRFSNAGLCAFAIGLLVFLLRFGNRVIDI